jgi:hypothetical protein
MAMCDAIEDGGSTKSLRRRWSSLPIAYGGDVVVGQLPGDAGGDYPVAPRETSPPASAAQPPIVGSLNVRGGSWPSGRWPPQQRPPAAAQGAVLAPVVESRTGPPRDEMQDNCTSLACTGKRHLRVARLKVAARKATELDTL